MTKKTFQIEIQDATWKGGTKFFEAYDLDEALRLAQKWCPNGTILEAKEVEAVELCDAFGIDTEIERHDRALTNGHNQPVYKTGKNWAAL